MTDTPNGKTLSESERKAVAQAYPTHVHVEDFTLKRSGAERARCRLLLNGAVMLENVRLLQMPGGHFLVSMPEKQNFGISQPMARAVSPELERHIHDTLTQLYEQAVQLQQKDGREGRAAHTDRPEPQAAAEPGYGMQMPSM